MAAAKRSSSVDRADAKPEAAGEALPARSPTARRRPAEGTRARSALSAAKGNGGRGGKGGKGGATAGGGEGDSGSLSIGPRPVDPEERRRMIAHNAYLRAERRGFVGGSPELDWLQAEAEVDRALGIPGKAPGVRQVRSKSGRT